MPNRVHVKLTRTAADFLLASGGFEESSGSPFWAQHFRKPLTDGGCLHLVFNGDEITVHRDRFNPGKDLDSLVNHIVVEAPVETAINAVMIFAGVSLLVAVLKGLKTA